MEQNNIEIITVPEEYFAIACEKLKLNKTQKKFTDVKIKIGQQKFEAHKIVLENVSPVLKDIFSDIRPRSYGDVYELSKIFIDVEIVKDLLEFCYTQHVSLTPDNVNSLMTASKFLHIQSLHSLCLKFVTKNFKSKTCLYCVGGIDEKFDDLSTVSCLDISTGKWENVPEMFVARAYFDGTTVGDYIFVAGGSQDSTPTNRMEVFDCKNNVWKSLKPMIRERIHFGMAELNGFIYIAGGTDGFGKVLSTVERYCPVNMTWKTLKSMNEERFGLRLLSHGKYLYAVSGEKSKTIERYDPAKDEWKIVTTLKHSHCWFGATVLNDIIFIISDRGFEDYYPEMSCSREYHSCVPGSGTTLVSVNGKLWAVGGTGGRKNRSSMFVASNKIFEFDPIRLRWTQLSDMNSTRKIHCSFIVKFYEKNEC